MAGAAHSARLASAAAGTVHGTRGVASSSACIAAQKAALNKVQLACTRTDDWMLLIQPPTLPGAARRIQAGRGARAAARPLSVGSSLLTLTQPSSLLRKLPHKF